jgi:hypothetical protein
MPAATKTREASLLECDTRIALAWETMRKDPRRSRECRREIDVWLDARLQLMVKPKRK